MNIETIDLKPSSSPFHSGEKAAQESVGVADQIEKFARQVVRPYMPEQHRDFYTQLPVLFAGHVDVKGWPWATLLYGKPGFLSSPDPTHLDVAAKPHPQDPLFDDLYEGKQLGLLGLEPHSRRRNRMNAVLSDVRENGFQVQVEQTFGNCPQYIQTRTIQYIDDMDAIPDDTSRVEFTSLDKNTADVIGAADTFFVSSFVPAKEGDPTRGVDMSHRGGRPGFVKVDGNTLTIPDYTGNFHFNTIGNFLENPKAGLLFIDFETGDILQLTGTVEVLWDGPEVEFFQGAERAWTFTLSHGIRIKKALPLRWEFGEMSLNSQLTGTWKEAQAAKLAEAKRNEWRSYRVVDIAIESAGIKSFYLEATDDAGLASFDAGQYLTIQAKPEAAEKELVRTYTLSSAPLDKTYRISVKKEGVFSSFLHDEVKVGEILKVRSPRGKFTLDSTDMRPAVLLAAGVGITPMISMLRHALQDGFRYRSVKPVTLIHSAKNSSERAFFAEATDMVSRTNGSFQYVSLLGSVQPEERQGVDYHGTGYITGDLLQAIVPGGNCDFYLCGPDAFMQSNYNLLRGLGVTDMRIHAESFGPASLNRIPDSGKKVSLPPAATEALVTFAKSGTELMWRDTDGQLLDFAEAHGFSPDYGCRNGACGNCSVGILKGEVTYASAPSAEIEAGQALICCARPQEGTKEVILDL